MPTIYTAAGVLGGIALLAIMTTAPGHSQGQSADPPATLSAAPSGITGEGGAVMAQFASPAADASGVQSETAVGGGVATPQAAPPMVWTTRAVTPPPRTPVAEKAIAAQDRESDFAIDTTLGELPTRIADAAGVPVLVDQRGIEFAGVEMSDQPVRYTSSMAPLRTAFRSMLRPHGLRVVVEDEGLVITADPAALVHQGIGTSRWINVDQQAAEGIMSKLKQPANLTFFDLPMSEAVESIGAEFDIPIVIDSRELQDIGLESSQTVSFAVGGIKLQNALSLLLDDLDLVITLQGETLVVTTADAEDSRLLHRVYWLEGTGIAAGDEDALLELITTTISPEVWEQLGGPSTIAPLRSSRPALVISTTFAVHQNIEQLLETLRETHFGVDPVLERIQVPASQNEFGGGMGGGFGGGGMGGGLGGSSQSGGFF
jgi:hypothetical protein